MRVQQANRLLAYRSVAAPVLVIGFADDVVTPPYLGREIADAMPNGRYLQIPDAGHLGFLERPQTVNAAALQFFEHAMCDVNRLPVREVVSASHFVTDLTLGLGEVVFDYLAK